MISRVEFHQPVYTVDPSGCSDADDGFSIWDDGGVNVNLHLMIHITDPTAELQNDDVFDRILKQAQTHYPFGEPPIHLFPEEILQKASLMNGKKKTISVHAVFSSTEFELTSTTIEYLTVECLPCYRFTYEQAAASNDKIFDMGIKLSMKLAKARNGLLKDNLILTIPYLEDGVIKLHPDAPRVKDMKSMIAEFAILANTVFAKGLSDRNVFLRAVQLPLKTHSDISSEPLTLLKIIEESVSAEYTVDKLPHDIVTGELYTHATSPLRRASDCIVHMMLKAQALNAASPFTESQLRQWATYLTGKSREFKQAQFAAIKRATLKWMATKVPLDITTVVMSYKNGFINIMITELFSGAWWPVNISYTLKRHTHKGPAIKDKNKVTVAAVNISSNFKFDEGTLPDIDVMFPH